MKNHEASFKALKSYYNDITAENLNLIKAQKKEIENLQASLIANNKQKEEIKEQNKSLEKPLEDERKERDELKK